MANNKLQHGLKEGLQVVVAMWWLVGCSMPKYYPQLSILELNQPTNLSVPIQELMIAWMNYLLRQNRRYKWKFTQCLSVNRRSQSIWLWFQQSNIPHLQIAPGHLSPQIDLDFSSCRKYASESTAEKGLEEKLALCLQHSKQNMPEESLLPYDLTSF